MENNNRSYTNGEITVHWKPKDCVHAGHCFRELRKVFDPSRRPWVDLSQATTAEIIHIVEKCPTDALTFEYNSGKKAEVKSEDFGFDIIEETQEPDNTVIFSVMRNGPILAEGSFVVNLPNGGERNIKSIASFCRCGLSSNLPFCDGIHNKMGFFPDDNA